ncbi:growth-regulating factor 6-like isoform X2 [Cucurbita pepo subsp. pepo]|uniref:growth-regulating factor 6-like isoform X2 n=1 Tax=Cucurbita pepo subsp. pepo TaxID=3664 RepID=UPI000C9D683E|nr:growth-regulating factor 6-like isoform X2 [Cucurbita pepo subsp. pepo]
MSARSMFPFTSAQWQELENQALVFKYMVSGVPIPPDLLFSIKRSTLESPFTSKLFPHHSQQVGWNCLQMSLGRKIDPEPGRCRRTDGKKWRCSKEAYPDSKYCERHMHRGKNRSRKPVDVLKTTATNELNHLSNQAFSSLNKNSSLHSYRPFPAPQMSSNPNGNGISTKDTNTLLLLDPGSYSDRSPDYRYTYGLKEEVDEHVFFSQEPSEATARADFSASSTVDSLQLTPLTMSCSSLYPKQNNFSSLQSGQSCYPLHQSLTDPLKQQKREESQKKVHRFFDEWPQKEGGSWLDFNDKSSNIGSVSTTRLSISIPTASNELPIFRSKNP